MALDRQKEAAEKKSMIQQQQQKQAEGLVPRMKVSPSSTDVFNLPMKATTTALTPVYHHLFGGKPLVWHQIITAIIALFED